MLKVNPRFETKEHYYNVLGINRYLLETNAKHGDVRDLFFYVYKNNIRNNIGKESFRTKLVIEAYCVISCSKLRELYNSFLVKKEIDKFQTFLSYQFSSFLECSDEAFKLIEKDEQVCVRLQEKVFKTALSLNIEKKENFFLICLQEEILDLFKLFKSKMMEVFHERQINRRSTFVDADNEFGKAAFLHVTLAAYRVFISLQSKKNVSDIEIIRELNELRIFSEKCLSSSFVTSIIDSFYWEFLSRRSNLGFNINEELTLFNDNLFP